MRFIATITLLTLLSACAVTIPRVGMNQNVADSDTAVFSVDDEKASTYRLSQIRKVDGKPTDCAMAGCPFLVRVSPGKHDFEIIYSFNTDLIFTVSAPEMKPKHIYFARRDESSGSIQIKIEEMPEGTKYGIGKKSDGSYSQPVTF